jgi:amidase
MQMPEKQDLSTYDGVGLAELIRARQVSPLEAVDAAIARIERLNPEINAVISERFERARKEAQGDLPDGPFRGVPFLVKDLGITMADEPYYAGTQVLRNIGYRAPADSALARRFRAAGLVVLGRTNTPEFGSVITTEPQSFGPTRNPWNTGHSTGGSSGGAAASVAAELVPMAHASDGGGSIRIPASACGLVGLKPSRGRISTSPGYDSWAGCTTDGIVSRTVRDTAAMYDFVFGYESGDPYTAPPLARPLTAELRSATGLLRIGFIDRPLPDDLETDEDCRAAVHNALAMLARVGHSIEQVHPKALEEHEAVAAHFANIVATSTASDVANLERIVGRELTEDDVEVDTLKFARWAKRLTALDYLQSFEWLRLWSRRVVSWWDEYDLLVTPTMGKAPAELGYLAGPGAGRRMRPWFQYTQQFNITGQPAISVPLHWNAERLPIGVQIVAAPYREDLLIRVASQLEGLFPWWNLRPFANDAHGDHADGRRCHVH